MPTQTYIEETALLTAAFSAARERFYNAGGAGALAPYDHIETRSSLHISYMPYYSTLEDHLSALANEINSFGYHVGQIEAWAGVLPNYEIVDQLSLLMEFVEPVATTAVGAPYALRSRFIYSTSHLCHQANRFVRSDWSESALPDDSSINYKTMLAVGNGWSRFEAFREALDGIFDAAYESETGGFRHKYQHRLPPRFQHGHTQRVSRQRDNGSDRVSYGFGYASPIQFDELAPKLRARHERALQTFLLYSELIREHISRIHRSSRVHAEQSQDDVVGKKVRA